MRVREVERNGAPRATLGWPRQSSSPAERYTRGWGPRLGVRKGVGRWRVDRGAAETSERAPEQDPNLHDRSRFGRSRSRSRLVLDRSHNHDGFHHHRNARSHSRRTMMPGGFRQRVIGGLDSLGSVSKRYVTFYFTNFPAQLSRFYLRKGFEVCGMLEDVYVAKKLNKFGAPYGFIKFSNVRDVNKLSKALNVVYFGHFRVRARVERFDRNVATEERSSGRVKVSHKVRCIGPEEVANLVEEGKASVVPAKGGTGTTEDVWVGDIVVRIGTPQEPTARKDAQVQEAGLILRMPSASSGVVKEKDDRILMRNFRTMPDDVLWAQNGLVATIINGEAVPVVQNRITDAGFHDLLIIPMGAEKVFIRSTAGADVLTIVNSAKDFFTLVFSNWTRWGKEAATYRRGAWVRLYGIPIHAWNVNFFKLCVFYCGRFLRADSVSTDRDRLDFARVLIATPDLEIINRVENLLVDGFLTEIKIVEEWGYALGEDTCLFEEESESEASHTDNDMEHIDPDIRRDVDMVVGKLVDELAEEDDPVFQENHVEHNTVKQDKPRFAKEGTVEKEVHNDLLPSLSGNSVEVDTSKYSIFQGDGRDVSINGSIRVPEAQGSSFACKPVDGLKNTAGVGRHEGPYTKSFRSKHTNSCPPGANHSVFSGPWSLEWLNDLNQRDAWVIFTASKRLKKGGRSGARQQKEGKQDIKRTKAGGLLRHSIHSLKKVARLPSKDRNEVLQVLTKNMRHRRGGKGNSQMGDLSPRLSSEESTSSASVNNDWKHWVVMQGDDKAAEDDVRGFGKALGVRFNGDSVNNFSVLTRTGKGKQASSGQSKRKGASKEKEC
ncbi:hypothetical protein TSUD_79070 [Trifolium subterraneum]|uniref:Uncharacterized protein n=1 Tax=Trifolium subterraneum TaxID=3900 RepID=A0A2Z6MS73_TRISU|nr:hypothetical protein TSUD_79070 [Trifolium subterraneum]